MTAISAGGPHRWCHHLQPAGHDQHRRRLEWAVRGWAKGPRSGKLTIGKP